MPTSGGNELILKSGGSTIQRSRRVTLRKIQNSTPRPCADSRARALYGSRTGSSPYRFAAVTSLQPSPTPSSIPRARTSCPEVAGRICHEQGHPL